MTRDELLALTRERLVRKIAVQYSPLPRLVGNEEGQRAFMADLAQAVIDELPSGENPDSIGLILDRAWAALFRSREYRTWPDPPAVLLFVRQEAADFERRVPRTTHVRLPEEQLSHQAILERMRARYGWLDEWRLAGGGRMPHAVMRAREGGTITAVRWSPEGPWEPVAHREAA